MWHDDSADKSVGLVGNPRMDLSAIYSKTPKGLRARASLIGGLSSHLMKVLTHVDGGSRAENILLKFDKLTAQQLSADLAKLEQEGYIRLATVTSAADDSWALTVNFEPMVVEEYKSEEALEASAQIQKAQQQAKQDQAEKLAAEQQAQQEEAQRLAIQEKAEKKAQKLRDKEKIKAEAKVKARLEEESREQEREQQAAAQAAETARIIAQAKIEQEAKLKAQQVAEQLEQQQAAERAAKLADETRLKAALKAREAAEQAEAQAEAMAKEHARREIERISRESEEAQKKQEFEAKAQHEAEHLEILRLAEAEAEAEAEAAEKARKEELLQQQLEAEALENKRMQAEKVAQEVALKQLQAQEKLAQEKLTNEAIQKEKLAKEQAHLEIANVLRKAEEDRKKAAAQLKAEKLEAKRQAKAEQEERLLAERKVKEEAKELAKEQAKQQKLKAQAEEKATTDAAKNESREQEKIAKQAEHAAKQEVEALAFKTEAAQADVENTAENIALEYSKTVQVAHAKLTAEEQANIQAKENALLEMERIGQEAELARQKTSTQQHLDENKKSLPDRGLPDKDLPNLDDFDATEAAEEAAFAAEEEAAEAEQKIQRTIQKTAEKTAKQSAENLGRADIRNAAIAEAEALAMVHGKASSFVSAKKIKQWLGSISKITFIYVPVLALVLLALLHFINLSTLIKPIEQLATESLGEPVEIKKVHASLWPLPHLVLEDVAIGANSIKAIHVQPQATSLFEQTKVLKSLVIEGLNIEQANFAQPLNWASNISRAKNLKVEQIYLKNLMLAIRDLQLESFDGKVTLTDTGALNAIDLVSSNNALSVNIFPQGSDYTIALKAANWALPLNQKIMFNSLSAKGIASNKQITFSQIEGDIYGGNLTAKADIKWPDGANKWEGSGDFKLTNANAEQLLNTFGSGVVISGKLSLDGNFSNKAREASRLTEATNMNASFDVRRGSIQGIELARAVMSRGSQSLAGDSTNFDKLTGNLKFNQGQTQFTKLVLAAPQFNANGFINLNASQVVTGRISANLAAQSRRLQANFGIAGRGIDLKSN